MGLHGKNDAVCGTVLRAYRPPPKAKLLSEKPNEIPLLAQEMNGMVLARVDGETVFAQ